MGTRCKNDLTRTYVSQRCQPYVQFQLRDEIYGSGGMVCVYDGYSPMNEPGNNLRVRESSSIIKKDVSGILLTQDSNE